MKNHNLDMRPGMFAWLLIPLLLIWLSATYLLGVAQQPSWQSNSSSGMQVLGAYDETIQAKVQIEPLVWDGKGLVTLWFDDGWLTQYIETAELLSQYDFKGTLAVTTGLIDYEAYMTWGQVKRLHHHYDWEITAHSRTHICDSQQFTASFLESEIVGSKQDLLIRGLGSNIYVAPCGVTTPEFEKLVKDEYVGMRGTDARLNNLPVSDFYDIQAVTIHDNVTLEEINNWLVAARNEKKWLILMFHQIDSTHSDYSLEPTTFRQIIQAVAQSDLKVVLPTQVLTMTTE